MHFISKYWFKNQVNKPQFFDTQWYGHILGSANKLVSIPIPTLCVALWKTFPFPSGLLLLFLYISQN